MRHANQTKYVLCIILAVCCLATGGIFVKLSSLPPINTGFYRVLFSIPLLLPFVLKDINKVSIKDKLLIMAAGVFLAVDLILWNISFHFTTVANGNLLTNCVIFTIMPVSYFIFKEKIPKKFFAGLIITVFGIVVLMSGKIEPNTDNFYGDLLALLASVFYALFLLTVYKVRARVNAIMIMFISAFGSIVVLFLAMSIKEGIFYPQNIPELLPLLGLALLSQILGHGILSFSLEKVQIALSSVLVLLQPVIAAGYAFLIFFEKLSAIEISGMLIALLGIYYSKKTFQAA